jgi:hypothetical protein
VKSYGHRIIGRPPRKGTRPTTTLAKGKAATSRSTPYLIAKPVADEFAVTESDVKEVCHSAKRTRIVWHIEQHLSSGATGGYAMKSEKGDSGSFSEKRIYLERDDCRLFEGGEDGIEFAEAEGAEDLGFEVADGGGAGGEGGDGIFAGSFGEDDAVVLAHGPEEFDDLNAKLGGGFLGGGGPLDRIDDVADSVISILKQQDVASHQSRSFGLKLNFFTIISGAQRFFSTDFYLVEAGKGAFNWRGWRVESDASYAAGR